LGPGLPGCQASGCTRALSGLVGFVNRQLSGGVRFEAIVRNGLSAADRLTERACVQSLLGAVECRQPIAELSREGVVCTLAGEKLRRVTGAGVLIDGLPVGAACGPGPVQLPTVT